LKELYLKKFWLNLRFAYLAKTPFFCFNWVLEISKVVKMILIVAIREKKISVVDKKKWGKKILLMM
jgi:hypothetical protein